MTLTERGHNLIALDKIMVDVRMGLACWNSVLEHMPADGDETTKTIRNACKEKLADLIPEITEG